MIKKDDANPIFDEDESVSDPEGVTLHRRCVPEEMLVEDGGD